MGKSMIEELNDEDEETIDIIMKIAVDSASMYYKKIKEEYKNEKIPTEIVFQAMMLLMIDGLTHTGVHKEIVSDHVNKHLNGETYFYTKDEVKLH